MTLAITLNPNPNPNPNQASTQEDEESGNDALDEGYLTRGGAQEAELSMGVIQRAATRKHRDQLSAGSPCDHAPWRAQVIR